MRHGGGRIGSGLMLALMAAGAGMGLVAGHAFAGTGSAEVAPAGSAEPLSSISIERFLKIRTPGAPSIAPDGTMYVRDWPDGIFQLYRVEAEPGTQPTAGPGMKATKLTAFADGLSSYSLSPDGSRILLEAAVGGNENDQIYLLDPAASAGRGGTEAGAGIIPITSAPRVQHAINQWLLDGSGFLFTANDESPNDFHIYRYDFGTGGKEGVRTKILAKPGSWSAADITLDGSRVLVAEWRSISDRSIYELTVASGELRDLGMTPPAGVSTVGQSLVGYLPGEKTVLLVADIEDGRPQLFEKDLASGATRKPLPELDGFEIDGASINLERTLLAVVTNQDGYGVMHLFRLPGYERVALPPIELGVVSLSELREDRVTWSLTNARTPGLAFTWQVPPAGSSDAAPTPPRQLTFADTQGIDLSRFTLPELVRYEAFDGVSIPAFLYLPPGVSKGTPVPFVINYHGGPESQFRPGFDRTIQYLLAQGFGVMQPNVRGSTGYGRAFHMMDDYKKRWDSVRDGVDAAAWLVREGYATPGHIATWGGSYGGYMAVATLVEDAERTERGEQAQRLFGAGVKIVGIVNVRTFLEQTSGYRRKLRESEYGPLSDPEFLASVSPIHRIEKIQAPIMIAHGLNDPRVPVGEAMQLAIGLKRLGRDPVELYFPDEGHGFAKLENRLLFNEQMVRFLKNTIAKP